MQSNCCDELPGISFITAVTLTSWSLFSLSVLFTGSASPKIALAIDCVNTIELGSFNALAAFPLINLQVNISKYLPLTLIIDFFSLVWAVIKHLVIRIGRHHHVFNLAVARFQRFLQRKNHILVGKNIIFKISIGYNLVDGFIIGVELIVRQLIIHP